jgi:hypothetical protein
MTSDIADIEAAIGHYFDGLYEGNVEKLARVFNAKASLFIESEGALTALPVPEWFHRVANRPAPAASNAKRDDRLLMIDRTGPVTALAKVTCVMDPVVYVDYLSLIKVEGRWQIVAKAYCKV